MADTVWASGFWATGFWADDFWAGGVIPPTPAVVAPPAGGRRIYDPDEHRKKYEPLTDRERRDLDRAFRERAAPRYVSPRPQPAVRKRIAAPLRPLAVPGLEPTQPADRIVAAKQFMALDALESLLDRFEYQPDRQARAREHAEALANAERLRAQLDQWEAQERERLEAQRIADEEDEMMSVLLAIHELA